MNDTDKRQTPEDIARVKWNRTADDYNQWDTLDIEEKRELIAMEATPLAERTTPISNSAAFVADGSEEEKVVPFYVARDLERQLAEAREQRDALAKAGGILADEYLDRRSQWGSEHLWTKHEDTEAVNAALAAVERSQNEPR